MSDDHLNPEADPFKPPKIPTTVHCIHCNSEYESYRIEWRVFTDDEGARHGFWCCPMPDCDGKGFGFDIFPIDPEYRDENGQQMGFFCDDDEDEDDEHPFNEADVFEEEGFNAEAYFEETMAAPDPPASTTDDFEIDEDDMPF